MPAKFFGQLFGLDVLRGLAPFRSIFFLLGHEFFLTCEQSLASMKSLVNRYVCIPLTCRSRMIEPFLFSLHLSSFTKCDMVVFGEGGTPEYVVEPFTTSFVTCAVLNGIDFAVAPRDILHASHHLGDYTGFAHLSVDKAANRATCDRFLFHDESPRGTPWGRRLPIQCSSCECLLPWELVGDQRDPIPDGTSTTILRYECKGYRRPLNAPLARSTRCDQVIVYHREHRQVLSLVVEVGSSCWMKLALLHGDFVREDRSVR